MSIARGSAVTLAGQWCKYAIQLLALVVLSRILSPNEFGVFALTAAIAGAATVIADSGLSLSALQSRTLSDASRSNLWWTNLAIGLACALALTLVAPMIASFFGEAAISTLLPLLSVSFILNGAAIQFRVEINRGLQFARLALIDVISQVIGFVVAVWLALADFGAMALVAQQIAVAGIGLVVAIVLTSWRPGSLKRGVGTRAVVRLGMSTAGTQIVNYISANSATIALGVTAGPQAVGNWNRATQIYSLPLQQMVTPITRVALPALSHAEDQDFARLLRRFGTALGYVVVGGLLFIVVGASSVVQIVLGAGWEMVVPLLQILALGAVFQAIGYPYYWAALARARMNSLLLAELPGRIVMTIGAIIAAPYGPTWVAVAVSVGTAVVWVGVTLTVPRVLQLSIRDFLSPIWTPVSVWIVIAAGTTGIQLGLPAMGPVLDLLVLLAAFVSGLTCALILPNVRRDLRVLYFAVSAALRFRSRAAAT